MFGNELSMAVTGRPKEPLDLSERQKARIAAGRRHPLCYARPFAIDERPGEADAGPSDN